MNSVLYTDIYTTYILKPAQITVAVQDQLSYSQPPKWRPSSTSGEVAKICPKFNGGGGGGHEGEEMTRRPAALLIAFEGESERGGERRGGANMSLY